MRPSRRSVATLTASATASATSAIRAGAGAAAHCSSKSAERAAQLLGADVVLVAVLDLAARDPARVEPGAVRGAEVLDEPRLPLADDGGVLAAHLAGVDHKVAVLAAADEEAILVHPLQLAPFAEQHEAWARRGLQGGELFAGGGVRSGHRVAGRRRQWRRRASRHPGRS